MENVQSKKLGAGIITISIIHLVIYGFTILGLLINLFGKDMIHQILTESGQPIPEITTGQIVITLVLISLLTCGIILIMCKKALGIYVYFTTTVINIVVGIIMNGFKTNSLYGLILPVLLGIFIYLKKEVFGFGAEGTYTDM